MIFPLPPPVTTESPLILNNKNKDDCSMFEYEALLLMTLFENYMANPHELNLPYDEIYLQKTRYEILFDHMHILLKNNCTHQCPMRFFNYKEIFHRPLASSKQCVEATGDVLVCSDCGRGHFCTPLECTYVEVCPWSARCRPHEFYQHAWKPTCEGTTEQLAEEVYVNTTQDMAQHMFGHKKFDGLKLFYNTRKSKKFPIVITEADRNNYARITSKVVKDLLSPPKKQSVVTFKRKRKFYLQYENDALNAPRAYLIKCRAAKVKPNWYECIRIYQINLLDNNEANSKHSRNDLAQHQLNDVINLVCKIIFKILRTDVGAAIKFDYAKMCVAIIYCLATQGMTIDDVCLIPQLPWIREHLLEQQHLGIVYKRKYDKSCIIEGQNRYKQIIRQLIMQKGYVYYDFCTKYNI